jgi:hypothetical protein
MLGVTFWTVHFFFNSIFPLLLHQRRNFRGQGDRSPWRMGQMRFILGWKSSMKEGDRQTKM